MGPKHRLLLAMSMCDDACVLAEVGIRARRPEYIGEEVRAALFLRLHGETTLREAFPSLEGRHR